ncbi:putative GTPase [Ordospora colligata]|nr:putative GTPase [Ordospora colligata]
MGVKKKQSRRLTTRKRKSILKKLKVDQIKKIRSNKKMMAKVERIPASVLKTDEEIMQLEEIKRLSKIRKTEYEEKMRNTVKVVEYVEQIEKMISKCETVVEVIDARDVESSRRMDVEQMVIERGIKLVITLNFVEYVPKDVVESLKNDLCKKVGEAMIRTPEENDWVEEGMKIGVFGNSKCGKNFVIEKISINSGIIMNVAMTVSVPPKEVCALSIIRGCHSLSDVPFRKYINMITEMIDRNEVARHYKICGFESGDEMLECICMEYGIDRDDENVKFLEAGNRFLEEFHRNKILFWKGIDGKVCFEFVSTG